MLAVVLHSFHRRCRVNVKGCQEAYHRAYSNGLSIASLRLIEMAAGLNSMCLKHQHRWHDIGAATLHMPADGKTKHGITVEPHTA